MDFEVEVESWEPEPFARGGQGTVHRAHYQGDVVALKRMSLVGTTAAARRAPRATACCFSHAFDIAARVCALCVSLSPIKLTWTGASALPRL